MKQDKYNLDLQNGFFIVDFQHNMIFAIRSPRKLGIHESVVTDFPSTPEMLAELQTAYPNQSFKTRLSKSKPWSKRVDQAIENYLATRSDRPLPVVNRIQV